MIMERTEVLDLMGQLRLFGMKNAYDEILATALKRRHEPQRFAGDLAEISEKQARSIKVSAQPAIELALMDGWPVFSRAAKTQLTRSRSSRF
jgi:hypothetical protein